MATKAIKFSNNTTTYLPVTDATLVQMKVGNETKSVQEVILEDEEVTAAAYNELNNRLDDIENTENSFNMWEILEGNFDYVTERLSGIDGGIHYLTQTEYNSLLAQFLDISSTYSVIYLQDETADSSKRKICTFYQENTGFLNDTNNSNLQNGFVFAFDGFEDTHNQSTKYTLRYFPNNSSNQQYFIFKNTDGYITDRASFKTQQDALSSTNGNNYGILVTSNQVTENSDSSFYGNPKFSRKITIQESTGIINGRITEADFAQEAGSANVAANAVTLLGGGTNQIAYQTNVNSTSFITTPTNNTYLMYNGSSFAWKSLPTLSRSVLSAGEIVTDITVSGHQIMFDKGTFPNHIIRLDYINSQWTWKNMKDNTVMSADEVSAKFSEYISGKIHLSIHVYTQSSFIIGGKQTSFAGEIFLPYKLSSVSGEINDTIQFIAIPQMYNTLFIILSVDHTNPVITTNSFSVLDISGHPNITASTKQDFYTISYNSTGHITAAVQVSTLDIDDIGFSVSVNSGFLDKCALNYSTGVSQGVGSPFTLDSIMNESYISLPYKTIQYEQSLQPRT